MRLGNIPAHIQGIVGIIDFSGCRHGIAVQRQEGAVIARLLDEIIGSAYTGIVTGVIIIGIVIGAPAAIVKQAHVGTGSSLHRLVAYRRKQVIIHDGKLVAHIIVRRIGQRYQGGIVGA